MVKKLQPKLRFRGFTDAWEQRRLGEIATVVGGGTPDTNNPLYWNGDINWFTPAEIGSNAYASKSERRITEEGLEHSSAKLLPAGRTILFTSRASIGLTAILTVDACTNQGFQSLVVSDRTDVFFLFGLCNQIKTQAIRNAAGSTFIEISGKQLAKMPLQIPSLDEQRRIGKIVRTIDSLIAAEKRKLELLEKKREELLQCVFSQRLRLNGCTEDCPQYSLAELEMNGDIHMGRGKVISAIQMKKNPGIYPVYSSSSKNNGEMGRYGEYMFDHELVTWSIDGGGHVFYRAKHRFSITNVCGYIQVRNNIDCSFLAYQMMFKHSKLHFDYTSKALPSLIKNMYDLSMPSLYEQERIGRLFKVFDSLIEFISHKIELTEQKKKALLQTMFL